MKEVAATAKAIFEKYNIPLFIDESSDVNQNILIKYILSILELFSRNWSQDSVFTYMKSGFLDGITAPDIYKLENYCVKWGIKGNKWYKQDWTFDQQTVNIDAMNDLRKKIVEPLLEFKKQFDGRKTAQKIATATYMFLEKNKIKEKLNNKIEELRNAGEIYLAEEYKRSYDIVTELLDEMTLIFGNSYMTFEEFIDLMKVGLKYSSLGKIPQVIDQVTIGDAKRTRTQKVKVLFAINLNDGMFMSSDKGEGFLNDQDREILREGRTRDCKNFQRKII